MQHPWSFRVAEPERGTNCKVPVLALSSLPPSSFWMGEVVWVLHMKAKSLWAGFPFLSPRATHNPASSQLFNLPVSKTPRAPGVGAPRRKTRVQLRIWTQRLRLCLHPSKGSVSPSQMSELINDNLMVKSVELSTWKPWSVPQEGDTGNSSS